MQTHTLNPGDTATPSEFRRSMSSGTSFDVRKQIAEMRECFEQAPEFRPDRQSRRFAKRPQFLAAVNENSVFPVDILSGQIRAVRLRGTGLIKELVIRAAFMISLTSDDCSMFFGSD